MNAILKMDAELDWLNPTADQLKSFRNLEDSLEIPAVLGLPSSGCRYMIITDDRKYDFGGCVITGTSKTPNNEKNTKRNEKCRRQLEEIVGHDWVLIENPHCCRE